MTHLRNMEAIRANCAERIGAKLHKVADITEAIKILSKDDDTPSVMDARGRRPISEDMAAIITLLDLLRAAIKSDIWLDIGQFAALFARDVLVDRVQEDGNMEPVVMLTGNSFAPAYRSFDEIELIWQADDEGEYIHELWERVESECGKHDVYIGYPEHDNSIYGVDLTKWEQSEASAKDMPMDDLNDEWTRIDPLPKAD